MRSIVAKNANSNETLSKKKVSYPKSYSLTDLKSSDSSSEEQD